MSIYGVNDSRLFALVEPITVTDSMYSGTEPNTTEGDPPDEWDAGTAYVAGDRVYYEHNIYQRLVDGTTADSPDSDEENWVYVSATNAWKMFDLTSSSQTVGPSGDLSFTVALSSTHDIDRIGFDNLDASSITVEVSGTGYSRTIDLESSDPDRPWAVRRACVFDDLPSMASKTVTVTAAPLTTKAKIGAAVFGNIRILGIPQAGFSTGISDFSRVELDDFGNYNAVVRNYAKRMSGTLVLESSTVDAVISVLAYNRARIAMFLGDGGSYASMVMCGFLKSWEITVAGPVQSYCTVDVQGVA